MANPIEEAAARGAIIIGLAQAQRDIVVAQNLMRTGDPVALGRMSTAVDLICQSYRAALEVLIPVEVMVPERVWNIDTEKRTVAL